MREAALIFVCLLAGCATAPVVPQIVTVTVEKIVPVPEALTRPNDEVAKRNNSVGEAVRLANARLASLKLCNFDKVEIRALGK